MRFGFAGHCRNGGAFTPLLGSQLDLAAGSHVDLDVDPAFEHGVLLDLGAVEVADWRLEPGDLAYLGPGPTSLRLHNPAEHPARMLLLGGTPFGEDLLMWWNFVARTHDEIVEYRRLWQAGADLPHHDFDDMSIRSPARLSKPVRHAVHTG
ncbi:pirin-like C-terminal cupin domain-containing protein [Candidatus Mycolicibacterium alkanivorans]|uniref:pirin-like C-terminal cupin domain-containing protein n=1 Tax=Candidatus Mycolicibacterium alkanivorans TaxID=2954114 RepID=UPI003559351D